jgi:uncharacterized protein (TIGR00255 family)
MTSMTGFAAVTHEAAVGTVTATLRAVNHRHLDIQIRAPAALQMAEQATRALIQRAMARGRVEVSLTWQPRELATPVVTLDEPLLLAVEAAFRSARERGLITGALTPGDLLRLPHVLTVRDERPAEAPEEILAAVEAAVSEAVEALGLMRRREGAYLATELAARHAGVDALVAAIERAAAEGAAALEARLHARLADLQLDPQADPVLVAQEVVRFVARSDIREELVRLRAHLAHWQGLVDGAEPSGRKLDFLLQEMNREVNTIGAKAEGTRVSELVVDAKAELEKMREQVQNVE